MSIYRLVICQCHVRHARKNSDFYFWIDLIQDFRDRTWTDFISIGNYCQNTVNSHRYIFYFSVMPVIMLLNVAGAVRHTECRFLACLFFCCTPNIAALGSCLVCLGLPPGLHRPIYNFWIYQSSFYCSHTVFSGLITLWEPLGPCKNFELPLSR